jgi:hypothetical protein
VPLVITMVAIISLFNPGALLRKLTRGRLYIEEEDFGKYLTDLSDGIEIL